MREIADQEARRDALSQATLHARQLVAALTQSERKVLELMVEGHSLNSISEKVDLDLTEVKVIKASLMQKCGATQTADIIRVGIYALAGESR